jgi:hypothetical protein
LRRTHTKRQCTQVGENLNFHRKIMCRHQSECPLRRDRIDKVITACKENPTRNGRQHETDFD